eukprot:gb/GECH01013292.1/.p1 GENE.gb/GECH01013292.1/~~gb/GECH01013292.1/.p1  ORF type:complete len:243 (+),score=90.26 gb/GECH01013292.1/:1-729(+)
MSSSVQNLCKEHQELIEKIWKKIAQKHELDVEEAKNIEEEFIETSESFGPADVKEIIPAYDRELTPHWKNAFRLSLVNYIEALRQVLQEAENNGVTIEVDLDSMDDDGVEEEHNQLFKKFEDKIKSPAKGKLPALDTKGRSVLHVQEENDRLKKQMERAQRKFKDKITSLQSELKQMPKEDTEEYKQEVERLQKEMDDRLANSAQFSNLKKIVANKNQQIKKLRERLAKYETEDTPIDSDDE